MQYWTMTVSGQKPALNVYNPSNNQISSLFNIWQIMVSLTWIIWKCFDFEAGFTIPGVK